MPASAREPTEGLLVVDKPGGLTSHDVVAQVRRDRQTRRVGHGGTLDPMATGVLVLAVGRATRLLGYVGGMDKEYQATIRLGASTTTDDAEGQPTGGAPATGLDEGRIRSMMAGLTGPIDQVPSSVSAVKVNGRRAYERVRAGQSVSLAPRRVLVSSFTVVDVRHPAQARGMVDLDVTTTVSSGTYVRALARDLGAGLGVGGHLTSLRRTRVGTFTVADAVDLGSAGVPTALLPMPDAARRVLPSLLLDADEASRLRHGVRLTGTGYAPTGTVAAYAPDGSLVAVAEVHPDGVRPLAVLG
ncbi:MAG: tRNA pseudouridine(55) synthase TruB [Actinomycetes bacterium]